LAEANLGAITYHFESKENLYHQVLLSMAEPLYEQLSRIPQEGGRPLNRIESFIRGYFKYMIENRELPCLLMHEVSLNRPVPDPVRAVMQQIIPKLAQVIKEGQAEGSIVNDDPLLLALLVVILPINAALQRPQLQDIFGFDMDQEKVRSEIIGHIVEFIRRSLSTAGRDT